MGLHSKENAQKAIAALRGVLETRPQDREAIAEAIAPLERSDRIVHVQAQKLLAANNPDRALKLLEAFESSTMSSGRKITLWAGISAGVAMFAAFMAWSVIPESAETCARREFSTAMTCPADRLEARVRSDITYASLHPSAPAQAPSPEIANDPGRLALWRQRQQKAQDQDNARHQGHQFVEVHGCDAAKLYECNTASRTVNNRSQGIVRVCSEENQAHFTRGW